MARGSHGTWLQSIFLPPVLISSLHMYLHGLCICFYLFNWTLFDFGLLWGEARVNGSTCSQVAPECPPGWLRKGGIEAPQSPPGRLGTLGPWGRLSAAFPLSPQSQNKAKQCKDSATEAGMRPCPLPLPWDGGHIGVSPAPLPHFPHPREAHSCRTIQSHMLTTLM